MSQITSLTLTPGAPAQHVTVDDQTGSEKLAPANITWAPDSSLSGILITPDATGFLISAPAGQAAGSGNLTATYTPTGAVGVLAVTVVEAVTELTFESP